MSEIFLFSNFILNMVSNVLVTQKTLRDCLNLIFDHRYIFFALKSSFRLGNRYQFRGWTLNFNIKLKFRISAFHRTKNFKNPSNSHKDTDLRSHTQNIYWTKFGLHPLEGGGLKLDRYIQNRMASGTGVK